MMKKALVIVLLLSIASFGQIKKTGLNTPNVMDGIVSGNSGSLFSFLNSDKFSMNHSFSMSYSAFAGEGLALGVYTNSMMYKFAPNFNVQLEASLVQTPYSTLGKDFEKNINGLYISKAAINYQPWKDVHINLQYRQMPYSAYYNSYYGGYGNSFWGNQFYGGSSWFNSEDDQTTFEK
jgi:hypothetical protein